MPTNSKCIQRGNAFEWINRKERERASERERERERLMFLARIIEYMLTSDFVLCGIS